MEQFNPPSPLILTGNLAENWRRWERRFGLYIVSSGANEEEEDVKKAILLHSIGEDALEVFNTLTVSSAGKSATMEDILKAFQDYCSPLNKDIQQVVVKEEFLPECQEWGSSLKQEEPPEPAQIKEEQEELWGSQELQAPEEDFIMFTFNPALVKSEKNDEEKLESSFHEKQSEENRDTEHLKTESDGEDWGGSETDRESNADHHSQPVTSDERSDLSGSDTDDSANWEESEEPQEGLAALETKDRVANDMKYNNGNTLVSSSECGQSSGQKKRHTKQKGTHTREKLFRCSVCGNRYPSKKNLREHMLRHSGVKRFSCSICQKSFIWKKEMVTHMRVHTGEKPVACSVCGKRFKQHGALKSHSATHTGEKPFSCSVCGKSFAHHGNLRAHAVVHTGEKLFSCSVCGKTFSQSGSLRRHSNVHTGEKLFSCSVCGKSFSQHVNLRRHATIHTGEKLFSCSICGKSFSRQGNLSRHSVVHKGETISLSPS
ncbi:zinc finger and SCAN domain-containing protein 2-like [Cheilinus undulatus]|uniref:zinc finger and SCAN domain-containing protein 2-like n=1 Tax=Cheilinus undulatus TaxID=241271 RepID=UPI001BD2D590|nr:zinc finger and SCAN domain-containing protein 2-like [Cheilinus undulatus]